MSRTGTTTRGYGKRSMRTKADRLFAELPQSPLRKPKNELIVTTAIDLVAQKLSSVSISDTRKAVGKPAEKDLPQPTPVKDGALPKELSSDPDSARGSTTTVAEDEIGPGLEKKETEVGVREENPEPASEPPCLGADFRTLSWDEVCPPGDQIIKIAEASYAEVYRVINERGTSIIKTIRLQSPIKAQTKAQVRSGLIDEEPHDDVDVQGELQISEWLADIPGFVVYKERYIVKGKTTRQLLETHQAFQKRMKREDPDRAQFYPSPSRYLDDTRFLVVELGDAGTALEDWKLTSEHQMWDIFFHEAIALARAEDIAMFEHRDLHEGNLCVKQAAPPRKRGDSVQGFYGYSGLEITILDYGLSRAEDLSIDFAKPVAYDMEKDLSLFTSTHAAQCEVYRQMRSFLLRADRTCLPPEAHDVPYAKGIDGPLSWEVYAPYTNVLWLAYLYTYLTSNFVGDPEELQHFVDETQEMWKYLNPDAGLDVPCFGSAEDIVCFAVEAGWVREDQLVGVGASMIDKEDSIILSRDDTVRDSPRRRSPRRQQ
jgi:serine/threonine-protein kinase haspin